MVCRAALPASYRVMSNERNYTNRLAILTPEVGIIAFKIDLRLRFR